MLLLGHGEEAGKGEVRIVSGHCMGWSWSLGCYDQRGMGNAAHELRRM